jgi:flagellin-like protein
MFIATVLATYILGMTFAPGLTRAVLRAISPVIGALVVVFFIFWRILPSSTGAIRRF